VYIPVIEPSSNDYAYHSGTKTRVKWQHFDHNSKYKGELMEEF
jgi:hypothetical protein